MNLQNIGEFKLQLSQEFITKKENINNLKR
jgi:hypothetical protein